MNRSSFLGAAMGRSSRVSTGLSCAAALALLLAACGDPPPPAPSPDRASTAAAATVTATATATASASASAEAPSAGASATAPAPSVSASAEPTATATAASAAPSGSASAAPAAKGFAFPAPKSGILTPAEADKLAAAGSKPRVRVLDAGKEPLAEIVYKATKGEVVPMRLDLTQKVAISAQGQAAPAVLSPPQSLDIDVKTEDASDTSALVAMLLQGISLKPIDGLDPEALGQIGKQLQGLKGYTLRQRIGAHGEPSESKVEMPPSAPQGAEQLLTSMTSVLRMMVPRVPDDAVGIGAKWQVLSREDHAGASVVQLTEYTLKARSDESVTVDFRARQLAANDNIKLPTGAPPGVTTKLTKFSTTTTGSLVVDTKQMAPRSGKATQDSKLALDVSAPGAPGKMKTDADMKMTVVFARRGGGSAPAATGSAAATAAPTATAKP